MKILIILFFVNFVLGNQVLNPIKLANEFKGVEVVEENPDKKKFLFPDDHKNRGGRIWNGAAAALGDFPHQAYLSMYNATSKEWYQCGGSFIRYNFVLTAAHCLSGYSKVDVYGGIINISNLNNTASYYFKSSITFMAHFYIHESYKSSPLTVNDIGLAFMANAPTNLLTGFAGSFIRGINLPLKSDSSIDLNGQVAFISGFGLFDDNTRSDILRSAIVPIISNAQCDATIEIPGAISDQNICISTAGGKGTCQGDSGGALVALIRDQLTVVGLTSFGNKVGCPTNGSPIVFTRITYYWTWISAKLALHP